jgi:hypothetical protein
MDPFDPDGIGQGCRGSLATVQKQLLLALLMEISFGETLVNQKVKRE